MRFDEVYDRWTECRLTQQEAADLLNVSERQFRRQCRRYESDGVDGLLDLRLGQVSARRAPVDEVLRLVNQYRDRYTGWTVQHFYSKYREQKQARSYNFVRLALQQAGVVAKAKRRGAHRRKRERKPLIGMMLHQDGSRHEWLAGQQHDLIVTLDDATTKIYSAFLVDEEDTMSSFAGVSQVILECGLFNSLYSDRGSHYWHTTKAGGKVDREHLTQFGRAMGQLGIAMIPAYSPEARGRSERAFRTLQERLPKELADAGITDVATANRFLKRRFLPAYNREFMVAAAETGSAFVPWIGANLEDILCLQEERVVRADNCVAYQNKLLQIPADRHRCHYVKAKVRVHEYPDHQLAIFHGPRCLAQYDAHGKELKIKTKKTA
ncbi:MAG: ISNCY family transposase [Betaproteobacteria bacterium]|nr:ISNCY family transposase [Betaproteobacteria bacterium]MBA3732725.1 ISNCY family transposase [Gammaproteobacteria bacterium]